MDDHVEATRLPSAHADAVARAPAPVTTRPRRPRLGRWLLVLLLLAGAGVVAWRMMAPAPAPAPRGGRGAALPPQPVGVATATKGDVRIMLDALGTVTPLATVTVRTQIPGQLQEVGFTEGQIVHKGDFLAQIDPRPYQALLEQYQGQLARDQALLKQAQVDLVRYQTLLKQDSIARQQAEDQIYLVKQYEGAIRSDQAQIDTQKLNLIYCHITSPVDGRVGLRLVDPGNFVQPSDANGLVVVTQLQPISVIFPLPEDNLPEVLRRYHVGATLPVTAYDRSNTTELATGQVGTIDNQIDTTTGTWKLRAIFPNADEMLFPNQFVNARLLVNTLQGVVTVPTAAVQRGAPGAYVWLVKPDDTVTVRPVRTGPVDGDHEQIIEGLQVGDRAVIDGTDRLREGAHVSVQEENGKAAGGAAPHRPGGSNGAAPRSRATP
ncbi:MAG TPA: MdtA/MuxA family multidrug efflux RND transporter periplasmic adaptor subunit [Acetobacteraceae bacterium]|nr:MdtA/MuxA family multidrug efflux RND transporter periplasmic adaptor subunit [Acetobacteraceae bacterium]